VVVLVNKSRKKMSLFRTGLLLLVSPATRLEAKESNATNRPSAEMEGELEKLFAGLPAESTEMLVVVLVNKSRTKMSYLMFGNRLEAKDANATNLPSAEMEGELESLFP
jgi:hypothetical protein